MQKTRLFVALVVVGFALMGLWGSVGYIRQVASDIVWVHSLRLQIEEQYRQQQQRAAKSAPAPSTAPAPAPQPQP